MNNKHIGAVVERPDGYLDFLRIPISEMFLDILVQLKGMVDNPNRSVLDMQGCFVQALPSKECFNYCLPFNYNCSHINVITYPIILTYNEYQEKLNEKRFRLKDYSDSYVEEQIKSYIRDLKVNFYNHSERYIKGWQFRETSLQIKRKADTRMISTEDVGWTSYEYRANEDVLINLKTNFAYGRSSYFFLNVKYKGIDILPYSAIVSYYHANVVDLIRYTRQYIPKRESWNDALDFVVKTANLAKSSPEEFIRTWIHNEITEMMAGLRNISRNPDAEIKRLMNSGRIPNGLSLNVRCVLENERKDYEIYKNEMEVVFKADKISGALPFLDKLTALVPFFPIIQDYVEEIRLLNKKLVPCIEKQISAILMEIERQTTILNEQEKILNDLLKDIAVYKVEIDALQEGKQQKEKYEIEQLYRRTHPGYDQLCRDKDEKTKEIIGIKNTILKRRCFMAKLEECLVRIRTFVIAA